MWRPKFDRGTVVRPATPELGWIVGGVEEVMSQVRHRVYQRRMNSSRGKSQVSSIRPNRRRRSWWKWDHWRIKKGAMPSRGIHGRWSDDSRGRHPSKGRVSSFLNNDGLKWLLLRPTVSGARFEGHFESIRETFHDSWHLPCWAGAQHKMETFLVGRIHSVFCHFDCPNNLSSCQILSLPKNRRSWCECLFWIIQNLFIQKFSSNLKWPNSQQSQFAIWIHIRRPQSAGINRRRQQWVRNCKFTIWLRQ